MRGTLHIDRGYQSRASPFAFSNRFVACVGVLLLACVGCSFSPLRHLEAAPRIETLNGQLTDRTGASSDVRDAASDGRFIGVALAGGGSRAAVFGGEVLSELHEMGVMRHVDFVSSISSGSLAGAYYCLSRDPEDARADDLVWRRERVEELMAQGVWLEYFTRYLNPVNLARYYGTGLNRSYQMRRVIDQKFFGDRTFEELNPERPQLLITATTLETGTVFTFTDEQLAGFGVRLSKLRISDAVQASSSFPGLFPPYAIPEYQMVAGRPAIKRHHHLVDGGVYDNLGVAPLLSIYQANRGRFPRGGVIIVADASLPAAIKSRLNRHADIRGPTDYVVDFGAIRKSIEIMFEVDRLGLMRALREDSDQLGLELIHLHYTTGVLSDDCEECEEVPNLLVLAPPFPTNIEFGDKQKLVAPTALRISDRHARATREAARRVIRFKEAELKKIIEAQ